MQVIKSYLHWTALVPEGRVKAFKLNNRNIKSQISTTNIKFKFFMVMLINFQFGPAQGNIVFRSITHFEI